MTLRIKGTQARSRDTRAAILDTVGMLLRDKSFDDMTLSEIAAGAGIAKGSVLAHFSAKQSILASFLADATDATSARLEAERGFAATAVSLAASLAPLLDFLKADKALVRLLATDSPETECRRILDPPTERLLLALIAGFGVAGHKDPELAADVALALTVHVAVAADCQSGAEAATALQRLAGVLY